MSSRPAVSVVVPTFDRGRCIRRAVTSVFAQTFQDFELIVVDDGSTDGTEHVLADFGDRLHYHRQEHRGVSAARNAGVELCRAPIVAFLDSDDCWLPDHLAVVTELLDMYPQAVLATTCPWMHLAGRERPRDARLVDALKASFVENVTGVPSCIAVRRDDLDAVGRFDEGLVVGEDVELWIRLAARGPFVFLQRRTVVKYWTEGSLVEEGSASGEYFPAMEVVAQSGLAEARRLDRPDRPELLAGAQGKVDFVAFLCALDEQDYSAARASIAEACRLLPGLSREAELVARRVERMGRNPEERLRNLAAAAELWPDPRADTALFLRGRAILAALGSARPRLALRLARRWPSGSRGFARRSVRHWHVHFRRVVQRRTHRN